MRRQPQRVSYIVKILLHLFAKKEFYTRAMPNAPGYIQIIPIRRLFGKPYALGVHGYIPFVEECDCEKCQPQVKGDGTVISIKTKTKRKPK